MPISYNLRLDKTSDCMNCTTTTTLLITLFSCMEIWNIHCKHFDFYCVRSYFRRPGFWFDSFRSLREVFNVLLYVIEFYHLVLIMFLSILSFSYSYKFSVSFIGFIWFYLVLSGFIWFYLVLSGFIWFYLVISGYIWFYVVLCGFITFNSI